jgi:hypothetical protein
MTRSRVFIPQEARKRLPDGSLQNVYDFTPAMRYGELLVVLPPGPVMIAAQPMLAEIRRIMHGFSDNDYLVATGDPAAIAACTMVAARVNHGRVNLLRWDRRMRDYYLLSLDYDERNLYARQEA